MSTISALPTPPSRDDPTNFSTRADAFLGALPTFQSEANVVAGEVNSNAATASTAASTASTAASTATTQAGIASAAASSATASANSAAASYDAFDDRYLGSKTSDPTVDNDGNTLLVGALYWNSPAGEMRAWSGTAWAAAYLPAGSYATLNGTETLTNKTLTDPKVVLGGGNGLVGQSLVSRGAGLSPIWDSPSATIIRVARTSNTILGLSNKGNLIDITSGTFTQTFEACTTLGSGWIVYIRNSGTGDITLDPNASETIDGLTSYVMYPGEVRLIQCDGTALRSVLLAGDPLMIVRDEKTSGTSGGSATAGSYVTRTLNTVVVNRIAGASLASNQITLPAGIYQIDAACPATGVGMHQARLYNVTDSSVIAYSTSMKATTGPANTSDLHLTFTLSGTKALRLEHRAQGSTDANDFGSPCSFGNIEVYSSAVIRRIA